MNGNFMYKTEDHRFSNMASQLNQSMMKTRNEKLLGNERILNIFKKRKNKKRWFISPREGEEVLVKSLS